MREKVCSTFSHVNWSLEIHVPLSPFPLRVIDYLDSKSWRNSVPAYKKKRVSD